MNKNLFLCSVIVLFVVLLTSCEKHRTWRTPFNYLNYECAKNSSVKQIKQSTFDAKKKLSGTKIFEFNPEGNLTRELSVSGTDTLYDVKYVYIHGKLIDILSDDGETRKLVYDNYGHLAEIRYFVKWKGKNTLFRSCAVRYDTSGRVLLCVDKTEAIGYLPDSDVEYLGCLRETRNNYQDGEKISYSVISEDYNNDSRHKQTYFCNDNGMPIELVDSDMVSGKTIRVVKYTYKNDTMDNWTERFDKENGKLIQTIKRELSYYTDEEIAATNKNVSIYSNQGENVTIRGYFSNIKERIDIISGEYDGGTILLIIVLLLTITGMVWVLIRMIKHPFFIRQVTSAGMSRMWMYDYSRYLNVLSYFGIVFGCFIGAILLIALVGCVAWLIAWIIKILFTILIWVGIILTVIGVLGAIAESEFAAALVVGVPILIFKNTFARWGESIVAWSFNFLQKVNMIAWGYHFFVDLWDAILFVFLTPIAVFLVVALVVVLLSSMLNGFEWVITRIYSIRRPCPSCGSTQVPDYMIGGKVHPVKLHPGTYGVFSHISPYTGEKIPTMLLNGKGKLTRKCPKCGTIIQADAKQTFGTDVHIGFVGPRSSGKSYLLYSGLSYIMKSHSDSVQQIDSDLDTKIDDKVQRINLGQGIQTNIANRYRAVQLMVTSKLRPVPYHLFFYDVAGEKFNASSSSYKTAMDFYKNVQSIVFILDPSMIDYTGIPASERIKNWSKQLTNDQGEVYRVDNAFSVLKDILESVGRKPQKIDFCFVCTKSDMGYVEADGLNRKELTEQDIERFIRNSLGLGNLVNAAKATFNSVHFFEISVKDKDDSKLKRLFEFIAKQQGVDF